MNAKIILLIVGGVITIIWLLNIPIWSHRVKNGVFKESTYEKVRDLFTGRITDSYCNMNTKMILGITTLALFTAVFLGYLGYRMHLSEQYLLQRPITSGRILSIEVKSQFRQSVRATAGGSLQNYWMVAVTYEYIVDGKTYVGNRLSDSPPMESVNIHTKPSTALTDYLARYPVGQIVQVHYDTNNPEKSLLEIDTSGSKYFLYTALIAALTALVAIGWHLFLKVK